MKHCATLVKMSEKDFRQQVIDLAKLLGYRCYFSWTSIHSPRGFPDLVMANPEKRRVIYAELKSETGKLTEYQEEWLQILRDCNQEVYIWRPGDFETIVEILRNETKTSD